MIQQKPGSHPYATHVILKDKHCSMWRGLCLYLLLGSPYLGVRRGVLRGVLTDSTRLRDTDGISICAICLLLLCAASCAGFMPYRLTSVRGSNGRGLLLGPLVSIRA